MGIETWYVTLLHFNIYELSIWNFQYELSIWNFQYELSIWNFQYDKMMMIWFQVSFSPAEEMRGVRLPPQTLPYYSERNTLSPQVFAFVFIFVFFFLFVFVFLFVFPLVFVFEFVFIFPSAFVFVFPFAGFLPPVPLPSRWPHLTSQSTTSPLVEAEPEKLQSLDEENLENLKILDERRNESIFGREQGASSEEHVMRRSMILYHGCEIGKPWKRYKRSTFGNHNVKYLSCQSQMNVDTGVIPTHRDSNLVKLSFSILFQSLVGALVINLIPTISSQTCCWWWSPKRHNVHKSMWTHSVFTRRRCWSAIYCIYSNTTTSRPAHVIRHCFW